MEKTKLVLIGFAIGAVLAAIVYLWQLFTRKSEQKKHKAEIEKYKNMLSDRMDVESEGLAKLKAENEELKKNNENLRITNANLMQKTGKSEMTRLQIYQKAVDRLTINSPGFGAAWQSALKDSEAEFQEIYKGTQAFWKKVLPERTNAKLISSNDIIDEQ